MSQFNSIPLPSADTIKNEIIKSFDKERSNLKELLQNIPGHISFTLDCWTSANTIPFLGITSHWINIDWQLQETLIDFVKLSGPHSGDNLREAFVASCRDLGIFAKLLAVTTDNAMNNNTFVSSLADICYNEGINFDIDNNHVHCLAHVMNIAVQHALKSLKATAANNEDEVLNIDDNDVNGFHTIMKERFSKACELANLKYKELILDVVTRWHSTYEMIMCAIEYLPEDVTTVTVDDNNNRKKRRSEVWEHFTFANDKAKCKHCIGGSYTVSSRSNSSTGNLYKHLRSQHPTKLNTNEKNITVTGTLNHFVQSKKLPVITGQKMQKSMFLYSGPGTGKQCLHGSPRNGSWPKITHKTTNERIITGQFNKELEGKVLLVLGEMSNSKSGDWVAFANQLKDFIDSDAIKNPEVGKAFYSYMLEYVKLNPEAGDQKSNKKVQWYEVSYTNLYALFQKRNMIDDAENLDEPEGYQAENNASILPTEILPTEEPPTEKIPILEEVDRQVSNSSIKIEFL
ncbi:38_t:CDS:10 [Entrophospora sp. SA101]|nr:38_t:CDS:10 [Entrophospora sp. SA101]